MTSIKVGIEIKLFSNKKMQVVVARFMQHPVNIGDPKLRTVFCQIYSQKKRIMYQPKVDVEKLNTVKVVVS